VAVSIPPDYRNPYLQSWRDKILFADPGQATIARLAATGEPEATFESALLRQEHDDWIETIRQRQLLRHLGLGLPLVLVLFCILGAALYLGAVRAIRHIPDRRSALLDPMPAGINWLPAMAARNTRVAKLGVYLLCLLLLPILAFLLSGNWRAALALLPALGGWLYAWGALRRGTGGHLGFLESRFVAVDYDGRYFYGEKSLLRGTGNFLLAPGVVLPISFAGIRNIGLPRSDARGPLLPPAQRSSWIEVLGSLWLYRHPWMDALLALCAGTVISAAALLLVQS
jgi:hypothetical protein